AFSDAGGARRRAAAGLPPLGGPVRRRARSRGAGAAAGPPRATTLGAQPGVRPFARRNRLRIRGDGVLDLRGFGVAAFFRRRRRLSQRDERADDHNAMHRYLTSRNSSMPYFDPSRPMPDSFTPPNGATSVEMMPVLMPPMPYPSASAPRQMRPTSRP